MHEGIHGNLFRKRRLDRWWGFFMGAPTMFCVTVYGVNHLLHHKHTRTEKDPDEFANFSQSKALLTAYFYIWIVLGMVWYKFRVPYVSMTRGSVRERRDIRLEQIVLALMLWSLLLLAWWFSFLGAVVHCWGIPMIVAMILANSQGWSEHAMTDPKHPLTQSRTVKSNAICSFLNINLNYHLEHHLFPGVPWYNLPKLHKLLLPEYEAAGSSIYNSYLVFLFDAVTVGIHGMAPSPKSRP